MRKIVLIVFFCNLKISTKAQSDDFVLFNEFSFSANRSLIYAPKYKIDNDFGFGLGVNHVFREESNRNPILGLEYQYIHFKVDSIYGGNFYSFQNAHFQMNYIKVSFSKRYHFSKESSLFLEPGSYINLQLVGTMKASYSNHDSGSRELIKQKLDFFSGIGCSLGLGFRLPVGCGDLTFRLEESVGLGRFIMAGGTQNETSFFYNSYSRLSVLYHLKRRDQPQLIDLNKR